MDTLVVRGLERNGRAKCSQMNILLTTGCASLLLRGRGNVYPANIPLNEVIMPLLSAIDIDHVGLWVIGANVQFPSSIKQSVRTNNVALRIGAIRNQRTPLWRKMRALVTHRSVTAQANMYSAKRG